MWTMGILLRRWSDPVPKSRPAYRYWQVHVNQISLRSPCATQLSGRKRHTYQFGPPVLPIRCQLALLADQRDLSYGRPRHGWETVFSAAV
jgi:hypothetical protein